MRVKVGVIDKIFTHFPSLKPQDKWEYSPLATLDNSGLGGKESKCSPSQLGRGRKPVFSKYKFENVFLK